MVVMLNGKQVEVEEGTTLLNLLERKGLEPERVVVEYNYELVKRTDLAEVVLKGNDNIEVLRFVGGG